MQPEHANPNDEPIQPLALQAAEKRLELCLASAGLGIWTYNIATDEFWANERAKHLHGHEPHEVHTLKAAGTNIYPEDRDRAQAILTEAIQTGAQLQLEYRVVWRDSSIHWLAAQAEFVPSGQPGEGMFYGTVQDISDRLRVEGDRNRHAADLAFLAEISQDLARLTNIAETVNAIAAKIGAYFNASLCTFSMVSEGAETITTAYAWHRADVPSPIGKQRLRDYHTEDFWQACRAGKTYVVCDVANDPRVNAAPVAALKIGAFVNVPQVRENEWEFSLFIADTELRVWREDEIELMQELTTRIWVRLDRAHTEAALHVSEEKYRTLFNSMDEAYAVVEVIANPEGGWSDFRFLEVNAAFVKHTSMEHPVGRTATQILNTPNPQWAEIYGQVVETGKAVRLEITEPTLNRIFDLNIFRLGDPNSCRAAVLFTDITKRKRAEDDRTQAQAAMQAFFSNVSHEFRTPLTLLLSSIQDTLSDPAHPPSSAQRSQLELAQRNAMRLLKLVNTLLDVSRIQAGHIQAVYELTDLATLTTELASSFDSVSVQAGLQLVIDCPPLPELVYVDRSMWEKIVLNLLSNALKFTFSGEIRVSLRWSDRGDEEGKGDEGDRGDEEDQEKITSPSSLSSPSSLPSLSSPHITLEVSDTGIGIAAAELPHLFERFYQVKRAQGRSFEGSGIGLSLVQELVKLHGGTIQVSSLEGEGSCFTVTIPTGFTHLPPEQIDSSQPLSSMATEASTYVEEALGWLPERSSKIQASNSDVQSQSLNVQPSIFNLQAPGFKTARILLVDDNADMRTYLKRLLEARWQVETAANGAIALTKIQQHPPELVLTDIMMPEMDGLQLLQALRAAPQTRSIPVILLSARTGEAATIAGLEMGADDYLIKPFSARELMARVETHLQLALLRQARSASQFKTNFLLTVTHELQAPLALILGWVRLLQTRSFDADTTAQALATIERNATIEAKLIRDLLDISSLLAGKVQLKSQFVELDPLLRSVTAQFRAAAAAKQIQLIETLSHIPQRNVIVDGDRLKQILANLLDNAIKFTPPGGQVTVELSLGPERLEAEGDEGDEGDKGEVVLTSPSSPSPSSSPSYIEIRVTDTGIGIRSDFLPYVFDRFTQAEVPSHHSPGGVGIGLAIARLLVELHQGTIEATSAGEGEGATFTVRLPLVLVNPDLNPNPTPPDP